MEPKEVIARARIKCKDMPLDGARANGFDVIQMKYDGWWVLVHVHHQEADIYSSGGRLLETYPVDTHDEGYLIGEFMYGTNWAQTFDPGRVYLHDVLEWGYTDFTNRAYFKRKSLIHGIRASLSDQFRIVKEWHINEIEMCWSMVISQGFEGLVYKNSLSTFTPGERAFGRTKRDFTMDYVILGAKEGEGRNEGRLGALEAGLYINGKLTHICSVGGGYSDHERRDLWERIDELIGMTFEAQGKGLFPSGALRHSQFIRLRPDKNAQECTWEKG